MGVTFVSQGSVLKSTTVTDILKNAKYHLRIKTGKI